MFDPEAVCSDAQPATAIIFTDSPRTPRVYLTIVATIKRFAKLSAEICDFGEIAPNTVHEKKVKLCVKAPINRDEIRLMPSPKESPDFVGINCNSIGVLRTSHPALKWNLEPDSSSECFLIKVKLGPVKVRGLFSSALTIALPNERTLTLPVVARVVSPVKVHPESLKALQRLKCTSRA